MGKRHPSSSSARSTGPHKRGALSLLGADLVSELTPRDVTSLISALFPSPVSHVTGQS